MISANRKTYTKAIVVLLLLCLVVPVSARRPMYYRSGGLNGDNYHFGYVSGSLGWGNIQEDVPVLHTSGSMSGSVGAGYEFRNSGLWASVGAQLTLHRSSVRLDEFTESMDGKDSQNDEATFHYQINQKDQLSWNFLDVPVMVGYYTHGFYVGAGLKVRYGMKTSKAISDGDYELYATYPRFGDVEFHNIPEQGYTTYYYKEEQKISLRPSLALMGEIGYDLLSSVGTTSSACHVLKLGVYFEYGVTNVSDRVDSNTHLTVDKNNCTKATINPYFTSAMTEKHHVVPFFTGVRLTYMLGGSRTARGGFHRGCQCYN